MNALRTTPILKTDISGSTPRLRALGERRFAELVAEHRDFVARIAVPHEGRIVKPEGDGFWLVFPSVTAAALAAMSMQEELRLAQANAGDERLQMRIVIALGDVLHADGGLVGEAVVLAARVEAITPPDEIYVVAPAWQAMNHAEVRSTFVDAFTLKGFAEPVTVYRLEQTHRTRLVADPYIVVTDLRGFTPFTEASPTGAIERVLDGLFELVSRVCREFRGTNRFNSGDGYCLTFPEARLALAAMERLAEEWTAFDRRERSRCPMTIAVHKGEVRAFRSYLYGRDLNVVWQMAGVAQAVTGKTSVFVSGSVRDDVMGTPWASRLERIGTKATGRSARVLGDVAIYGLREVPET